MVDSENDNCLVLSSRLGHGNRIPFRNNGFFLGRWEQRDFCWFFLEAVGNNGEIFKRTAHFGPTL